MSKFAKSITEFVTCEVGLHGKVSYFAKLGNGHWVAVKDDGSLDWMEVSSADFSDMLEAMESMGANIRFTNHSAI